jgi:DNA-binding CsgD family transcriptional regulator
MPTRSPTGRLLRTLDTTSIVRGVQPVHRRPVCRGKGLRCPWLALQGLEPARPAGAPGWRCRDSNPFDLLVRRREALANFRTPVKRLSEMVRDGRLAVLLDGPVRPGSETRETARQRRLSPAEIDELAAEYRSGNATVRQLAAKRGVSRNVVSKHLRSRGLELGPQPLTRSEILRVQSLGGTGMSLNAIGREIGRDPKTVKAALTSGQDLRP